MEHYIDKATLVAEIKRLKESFVNERDAFEKWYHHGLDMVLYFLDTIETKEVDEEYNGKAMLHVLTKGVEQGKREMLDKACEWWEEELSYPSMTPEEIRWYKNKVNKFRKAMEE